LSSTTAAAAAAAAIARRALLDTIQQSASPSGLAQRTGIDLLSSVIEGVAFLSTVLLARLYAGVDAEPIPNFDEGSVHRSGF